MQSRPTQPSREESSSLRSSSEVPNFSFAAFNTGCGCGASVASNKSSLASTWVGSSTSSRSASKLLLISSRTSVNHSVLNRGWAARSCLTSSRKSLNLLMPSLLHFLSSVVRSLLGSDFDVLVYFGKTVDFQWLGTVSSVRTERIFPPDFL